MYAPAKKLRRPWPLWEKQAQFLDSKERIKGFVSGIGAGKSKIGAYDLLCKAKAGRTYVVTAPTYGMLRDATFKSFEEVARYCGQLVRIRHAEFTAIIKTDDGGIADVLFRSTDAPDRLRGPNLSGVWMDEGSLSEYEAFQILVGRLREGGEAGWLDCTFTPKGLTHWTYEVFGSRKPGIFLVHARTDENPFLAEEFIQQARDHHAGLRARQELGGEFITVEGAEWPPEFFPESMWFDDWPARDWKVRVMALDPSKGSKDKTGDYSAWVMLGVDDQLGLWVDADLDNMRGVDPSPTDPGMPSIVGDGVNLICQFRPSAVLVETNGFQSMVLDSLDRHLRQAGILTCGLYGVNNTEPKDSRIRGLTPYLAQRRLRIRRSKGGALLMAQMRDFPVAEYRDGPDALKIAEVMADYLITGSMQGPGRPEILRAA